MNDLAWNRWCAYMHPLVDTDVDLSANIEFDDNGNPDHLRTVRRTVPGCLFQVNGVEVRAPDVVKPAGIAQELVAKYGPDQVERIKAALLVMYKVWMTQPILTNFHSECAGARKRIMHQTERRALTLQELRSVDEQF